MKEYSEVKHIKVEEFFKNTNKDYFVYLYFTYCPHCNLIKEYMIDYASKNKDIEINFICMDEDKDAELFKNIENKDNLSHADLVKSYVSASIGKDKLEEVGYYYVPSLYHVVDHKIENIYVGEFIIKPYLINFKK